MKADLILRNEGPGRLRLLGGIAALMVLPVVVLRAIEGYEWDPGDAVFLGILLAGIAFALEIASRIPDRLAYGAGLALALFAGLAQIWVNLAVGIVGSEDEPINLIYFAVPVVAVIAAIAGRFRAGGMARAMALTALTQAGTFFVALAAEFGFTGPITIFFVSLWLISAGLFRRAAQRPARPGRR